MDKKDIVQFSNTLKETIDEYSDIKDSLINEELLELVGDCSKIVKVLVVSKKIKDKFIFKHFLKGFSIGEQAEKEKLDKLKRYINDEDKALFVSQILDNVLNSKSKYSSFILGYMLNTMIKNSDELSPKYVILAEALTHMFDHDIKHIKLLGDFYNNRLDSDKEYKGCKEKFYIDEYFMHILDEKSYSFQDMHLTIEKCISYQLIEKKSETSTKLDLTKLKVERERDEYFNDYYLDGDAIAETFIKDSYKMTIVGDLLYEIMCLLEIE